ncbi:MAG: hypothetical protein ACI9WU_000418 [Myxococcota bacterium]|jgi:hypothetical protein
MHRSTTLLALAATIASSAVVSGCSSYSSFVDSEASALGRVVVYRNGIAYFERRARVEANLLSMAVPHDKVDDFLKSLTVRDAASGKAYPVSFPTNPTNSTGTVDMVVQVPQGQADVVLSYITESPAWKPSYRLVVEKDGAVNVQGWAIVDNTSGEHWKSVRLGVGSSSALSFRYDLRTVRNVHRQTLHDRQRFAVAPPTGGAVHRETANKAPMLYGSLADKDIPRPVDHPDVAQFDLEGDAAPVVVADLARGGEEREGRAAYRARVRRGSRGRGGKASPAKPKARVTTESIRTSSTGRARLDQFGNARVVDQLASKLKSSEANIVIEGYANRGERDGNRRALDRANLLRNQLIKQGVAPAQLRVKGNGWVQGQSAGVRLIADESQAPPARKNGGGQANAEADAEPIGESHFESKTTMTVNRGTSAMVSILDDTAKGEVVYFYDPETKRGNKRFAFKAVRFINPTDSTLESGPVTVYGNGRFIGEGLSTPIPPAATAFVPFALDRQVIVSRKGSTGDEIAQLISLQRGVLTAEVQHTRKTRLTLSNRQGRPVTVYVRHNVRKGWTLTKSPKAAERLSTSHIFKLTLPASGSKVLELHEATPLTRTIDLRTQSGLELVRLYLKTPREDKRFDSGMRKLLELHKEMHDTREHITSTRERMEDFRERIDELHSQIVNLQQVKGGGQRLMRHLKQKMIEISNRLQRSTINVVDLQQKLMLARIRFQDGVAELTLQGDSRTADVGQ